MLIRLLVPRATSAGPQNIGDELDVSDDEARSMIEAGQAAPVRGAAPEKATPKCKAERASK